MRWHGLLLIVCVTGCRPATDTAQSPRQLLEAGWRAFRLADYDLARRYFDRVAVDAGARNDALYGLATVAALGTDADPAEARRLFGQVIVESPGSESAAWSALGLARLMNVAGDTDPRVLQAAYQDVIDQYPLARAADEAFVYQQVAWISTEPGEAAVRDAVRRMSDRIARGGPYTDVLYKLRAAASRSVGDMDAALSDDAASIGGSVSDAVERRRLDAPTLYRMGVSAQFDAGDFTLARRLFGQFLEKFPTDQRAFTVLQLLKEMTRKERDADHSSAARADTRGHLP